MLSSVNHCGWGSVPLGCRLSTTSLPLSDEVLSVIDGAVQLRKPELKSDINLNRVEKQKVRLLSSESTVLINDTHTWALFCLHGNLSSTDTPFILWLLQLFQGYEDWLRHKADCSINESPVDVVQQGRVVRTQSHKLRVRMASLAHTAPEVTAHLHTTTHHCSVSSLLFTLPQLSFLQLPFVLFSFAAPEGSVLLVPCRKKAA